MWCLALVLAGSVAHAVVDVEQLRAPASAAEAKPFATPGLSAVLGFFSPTLDGYLQSIYLKLPETLPLWFGDYSWDRLDDIGLADLKVPGNAEAAQPYLKALDRVRQSIEANDPLREEKLYLRGDLQMLLWRSGRADMMQPAYDAYADAVAQFADSRLARHARYHQTLILMDQREYLAVSMLANREAERFKTEKAPAMFFRGVLMENYYRAGRYVRGESFMWELARLVEREELTEHLALRYGDMLFWGERYEEVVEWYAKMQVFLEHATTSVTQMSQLYYAEALFQTGKTALAELVYSQFEKRYQGKYPRKLVAYRRLQCQLAEGLLTPAVAMQQLTGMIKFAEEPLLSVAAELTWTRLALLTTDEKMHEEALLRSSALADRLQVRSTDFPSTVIREALLMQSLANWRQKHYAAALTTARMVQAYHYRADARLRNAGSNAVALLLTDIAPLYFENDNPVGFLVLAHRLRDAIEEANYQTYALPWVARAYLESGMTGAAARLYQRIFFDMSLTDLQSDLIMLELARSYGLMGKSDLLDKTLSMIRDVPDDPRAKQLYLLTHAVNDVYTKQYGECVERYEQLMKSGVRGDELFSFAVAGAQCARLAGKFDVALKFVGMVIPERDKILEGSGESPTLRKWRSEAIFEKIEVLSAKGDHQTAVELFELVRSWAEPPKPTLPTVFAVVQSYRALQQSDKAAGLWTEYGGTDQDLPQDAVTQYGKLLELLSQKELLPEPVREPGR